MMHYQQQQHPQQPQQLQQSQQQTQQQSQQQTQQPHSLQQTFNPISATSQQYQQYQQPSQLFNPQQSVQQYLQQPIRPRGDSIGCHHPLDCWANIYMKMVPMATKFLQHQDQIVFSAH